MTWLIPNGTARSSSPRSSSGRPRRRKLSAGRGIIENMFDSMRELDPAALVAEVESTYRQESALMARRMAAVAALLRHRDAALGRSRSQGFGLIGGFEQTTAEVAAAMNLSPMAVLW